MRPEAHAALRRSHQRRCEAISLLLALDSDRLTEVWRTGNPDVVLELNASLAEIHGLTKRCARLVGVEPAVMLPPSVSGNGSVRAP